MNRTIRDSTSPDPEEEELDNDIRSIRAQIQTLKNRKRILTTTLLSSTKLKPLLAKPTTLTTLKEDLSPLTTSAGAHKSSNYHRIAFGATAFPFKDPNPNPNNSDRNLLGLRIDICGRNGRFTKPYYVLLRREKGKGRRGVNLAVHRHTIPGFISVEKLAGVYLVGSTARVNLDGDGDSEEDSEAESEEGGPVKPGQLKTGRKQDLRGFVRELRRELMAWHLRSDAIVYLREKLGLEDGEDRQSEAENEDGWEAKEKVLRNDLGIVGLEATATEARYVRMEWEDGRLGRFKLSNTGTVERAVFMNDNGRDKQVEDAMTGGGGRVESLFDRLKGISSESAAEVTP